MAKPTKNQYVCSDCGGVSAKWSGQCPNCQSWNTLIETAPEKASSNRFSALAPTAPVQALSEIHAQDVPRFSSELPEFDRVLGGGLVSGGVILIGGDPGIGKSTLLLQSLAMLSKTRSVLYVSGEESGAQIALRAQRLDVSDAHMQFQAEINLDSIINTLMQLKPDVAVIDSIQTMYSGELSSAPGSVAQVRECAAQLTRVAKATGITLIMVGHVTKEGSLAGPRVLEHIVDTVLYFEGDTQSSFRLIRAFKNRFGAVNELGVFGMTDRGLKEVSNPSAIFLNRAQEAVSGSVVMATWEGSRPMLIEVQALVDTSHLGNPRRVTVGLDQNRLAMLLAVLHRHGGIPTHDQDVFLNVVGGVKVLETASDLALMAAIISSLRNRPLEHGLLVFGEIGLSGEIRPVPSGQERLKEAAKHGFKRAIVPKANAPRETLPGLQVIAVTRLEEALDALFE